MSADGALGTATRTPTMLHCQSTTDAPGKEPASEAATVQPAPGSGPPDLIIQDELHLITGALGTGVGLFEAAVERSARGTHAETARRRRPLIVASTATVRNADDQVRGLYGRGVEIFPPQVLDVANTYFSRELRISAKNPARSYLGVCAHGIRLDQRRDPRLRGLAIRRSVAA